MKIATWNVNSVKSRLDHLRNYLKAHKPDILCLQELKCVDENFPLLEIQDLGYNAAIHGQKTYNGVAILSKLPLEDVTLYVVDMDDGRLCSSKSFDSDVIHLSHHAGVALHGLPC